MADMADKEASNAVIIFYLGRGVIFSELSRDCESIDLKNAGYTIDRSNTIESYLVT